MSRIGVIGTGHIAAPMVRHLAAKGHQITVTDRNAQVAAALRADLGIAIATPQQVIDASDIVLLCLRPNVAAAVLQPLRFRADQQIVSVMAGISAGDLARLCAPATDFVQTIPLGFVQQGGCPLPAYGNAALLADLFAPENPVVPVDAEAALNAHFAISTMTSCVLDMLDAASGWLAQQTGNADRAEFYTSQLIAGFLGALDRDSGAGVLARERDALATEGSLNLQMVTAMKAGHMRETLTAALTAINDRLENSR